MLMALVFYYKNMLKKVTMQINQQYSQLLFVTERTQMLNVAHAQLLKKETDCFYRNLPISIDPVVRVSRKVANKKQKPRE